VQIKGLSSRIWPDNALPGRLVRALQTNGLNHNLIDAEPRDMLFLQRRIIMKKFVTTMIGLTAGGSALIFAGCGQDEQEYREPTVQADQQREADAMALQRGNNNPSGSEQERQGTTRTAEGDEPVNIALYEEELNVQKREVPAGGVVIQKKVETEPAEESVELRHETIEVTRLSPEEAKQRQQEVSDEQPFTEDEVFIPLAKEEAVPEREAQIREVVRAERGVERSQETVEEEVRREVVDYEDRSQKEARQQGQSAQRGDAQVAATTSSQEQQNQQQTQPEELEQRVERELAQALPQDQFERIDISVDERTVALQGTVNDEETARGVEDYVSGIQGVENVENRLQIAQR